MIRKMTGSEGMGKMLAVVKKEIGIGAQLEEIEVPGIGPKDVLIKVNAAAICGTDLHIYDWNPWAQNAGINLPVIMGHEFCGEIVQVGDDVTDLKPGDYIAGETHIPCGKCYQCNNGQQHICGNLQIFGVHTNGCFAEYTKIPAACARKIPSAIKPEIGAVLEPLGTALRAGLEIQVSGKVIAVIGCGPIGLFAIASAKAMGASYIIAIDVLDERLKLSETVGANIALNPMGTDVVAEIKKMTKGVGVDGFIDASGSVQAINDGFKYLRKGGEVALIGLPSKPISIDLGSDVVFKEAKIIGIHGREMYKTWIKMENMLSQGLLNLDPVITHTMPLEKFQDAVELLQAGHGSKIVLIP